MTTSARIAGILGALAACGGGGPGSLSAGTWRLTGETLNGAATAEAQLDGALELTDTDYALGIARPARQGVIATYTVSGDSLVLGGGGTVGFGVDGQKLTLRPDRATVWTFEKITPTPAEDAFTIRGTVTIARGAPPMARPRVSTLSYTRAAPGFFLPPSDDQKLAFDGDTASFDLSRARGALGFERLEYGTAAIAIILVVVYDDIDGDGMLHETGCSTTTDCVRGVSPVVVAARDRTSPELAASPFGLLRQGWSHAVMVTDQRHGGTGLASTDPSKTYQHEITIGATTPVALPAFDLTVR